MKTKIYSKIIKIMKLRKINNEINFINDKFNKNSEVTTQNNKLDKPNEEYDPAPTFINEN